MNLSDRLSALMSVAEFQGVAPPQRATLAAAMREERFLAGATIVAEGEFADRLFVLCAGTVEISQRETPGRIQRLGRGALIGELAFFAHGARTATVSAATDCELLSLPFANFREFLLANPESALKLCERLARKLLATEAELAGARQALAPGGVR